MLDQRITEYSELNETHKDDQSPTPIPAQANPKNHTISSLIMQKRRFIGMLFCSHKDVNLQLSSPSR